MADIWDQYETPVPAPASSGADPWTQYETTTNADRLSAGIKDLTSKVKTNIDNAVSGAQSFLKNTSDSMGMPAMTVEDKAKADKINKKVQQYNPENIQVHAPIEEATKDPWEKMSSSAGMSDLSVIPEDKQAVGLAAKNISNLIKPGVEWGKMSLAQNPPEVPKPFNAGESAQAGLVATSQFVPDLISKAMTGKTFQTLADEWAGQGINKPNYSGGQQIVKNFQKDHPVATLVGKSVPILGAYMLTKNPALIGGLLGGLEEVGRQREEDVKNSNISASLGMGYETPKTGFDLKRTAQILGKTTTGAATMGLWKEISLLKDLPMELAALFNMGAVDTAANMMIETGKMPSAQELLIGASQYPIMHGLVKGAVKAAEIAPEIGTALTKDIQTKYGLPKSVSLSGEQVRSIINSGVLTTPEQTELFHKLALNSGQIKQALITGVNIEVPLEKVTTIIDKPYWGKIKSIFNIKPFKSVEGVISGKPVKGPAGLLNGQVPESITPVAPVTPQAPAPAPVAPAPAATPVIEAKAPVVAPAPAQAPIPMTATTKEDKIAELSTKGYNNGALKRLKDSQVNALYTREQTKAAKVAPVQAPVQAPAQVVKPVKTKGTAIPNATKGGQEYVPSAEEQQRLDEEDKAGTEMAKLPPLKIKEILLSEDRYGDNDKRNTAIDAIEKIGAEKFYKAIGWPTEPTAKYINRNTGDIEELQHTGIGHGPDGGPGLDAYTIENWAPADKAKEEGVVEPVSRYKTAREAAKDFIRHSVENGTSIQQIKAGQGGAWTTDAHVGIGGYLNGKKLNPDKIKVEKLGWKTVNEVFSLPELYNEIKNEISGGTPEITAKRVNESLPKAQALTAEQIKGMTDEEYKAYYMKKSELDSDEFLDQKVVGHGKNAITIWEHDRQQALAKLSPKEKTVKGNAEFKVGDVLDPQGKTNMTGKVTIREIKGNTLKFTDDKGIDYSGMSKSLVRDLIKGGSWKRVGPQDMGIIPEAPMLDQLHGDILKSAKKTKRKGETLAQSIQRTKDWISSTLSNDENSTDEEMADYFMKEGGFSKDAAEFIVSRRQEWIMQQARQFGAISEAYDRSHRKPIKTEAPKGIESAAAKYDAMPEIIEARAKAAEIPVKMGVAHSSDIDTPERHELRKKIRLDYYKENEATKKEKILHIVIGLNASGKSKYEAEPLVKELGAILIDNDKIKDKLIDPEIYQNGLGAGFVHKESSKIMDTNVGGKMARRNGDNIVWATIGKNTDKVLRTKRVFKKKGYKVFVTLVDLSPEKAAERVVNRFLKGEIDPATGKTIHRFVDPNLVFMVGNKHLDTYDILKAEEDIDGYKRISTDVPKGSPARVIEEYTRPDTRPAPGGHNRGELSQRSGGRLPDRGLKTAEPTDSEARIVKMVPALSKMLNDNSLPKSPVALRAAMKAIVGGDPKQYYDEIYDSLEMAINKSARQILADTTSFKSLMAEARRLEQKLPLRGRSIKTIDKQQFSTPIPLAAAAHHLLDVQPDAVILEPTAGTGNMVIPFKGPEMVNIMNEFDPVRAEVLKQSGTGDQVIVGDFLTYKGPTPDAIIGNPPFGALSTGKYGKFPADFEASNLDQRFINKMIRTIPDGGRIVVITSQGTGTGKSGGSFRKWLQKNHTLLAVISSPDGAYKYRGVPTVKTDLMVIEKGQKRGIIKPIYREATDWDGYTNTIESIAKKYPSLGNVRKASSGPVDTINKGGQANEQIDKGADKVQFPATESIGGESPRQSNGTNVRIPESTGRSGIADKPGERPAVLPGQQRRSSDTGTDIEVPTDVERRNSPVGASGGGKAPDKRPSRKRVGHFIEYQRLNTLNVANSPHPSTVIESEELSSVEYPKLTYQPHSIAMTAYKNKLISDPQMDFVQLALQAFERQNAILQADGTGLGKTRAMAATIAECLESGKANRVLYVTINKEVLATHLADDFSSVMTGAKGNPLPYPVIRLEAIPNLGKAENIPIEDKAIYTCTLAILRRGGYRAIEKLGIDMLVVDEAHLWKQDDENSATAIAWESLHKYIGQKPTIYATATPGSDLKELSYLKNLDLGAAVKATQTAAKKKERFRSSGKLFTSATSIPFAQQVMREAKMKGLFTARDLDLSGVTYGLHKAEMSEADIADYDRYIAFLKKIHDKALKYQSYSKGKSKIGQIKSQFQFAVKRYQVDLKVRKIIDTVLDIIKTPGKGDRVLLFTNSLNPLKPGAEMGHARAMINAINEESIQKINGVLQDPELMPEAVEEKQLLIEELADYPAPLDIPKYIKEQLGKKLKVVDYTGKTGGKKKENLKDWMSGKADVMLGSAAAKTAISAHDMIGRPITVLYLDIDWTAELALQALGRVARSGQVSNPTMLFVNMGAAGEQKFMATIATRFKSLGAVSKGQAESGATDFLGQYDLEGTIANEAARRAYSNLPREDQENFIHKLLWEQDPTGGMRPRRMAPQEFAVMNYMFDLHSMPFSKGIELLDHFREVYENMMKNLEASERYKIKAEQSGGKELRRITLVDNPETNDIVLLHEVQDKTGKHFGILTGMLTDKFNVMNEYAVQQFIKFTAGRETFSGYKVLPSYIPTLAEHFGKKIASSITPDNAFDIVMAGDKIPVGGELELYKRQDGDIGIKNAKMKDKVRLMGAGAGYNTVGSSWVIKDPTAEKVKKFLKEYPLRQELKEPVMAPKEDKYYIYNRENKFETVEGNKLEIPGFENYDTFIHKTDNGWSIVEAKSGMRIASSMTRNGAIENATQLMADHRENVDTAIEDAIKKNGRSPRYGESTAEEPQEDRHITEMENEDLTPEQLKEKKAALEEGHDEDTTGIKYMHSGPDFTEIMEKLRPPKEGTPQYNIRELIFGRESLIQEGLYESNLFTHSIIKAIPNKVEREAIPFLIERTDVPSRLNRPDIQKVVDDPSPELLKAVRDIGDYLEKAHDFLMESYGEDIGFWENYISHFWKRGVKVGSNELIKNKERAAVNYFIKKNPNLKKRFIDTYYTGIEKFGLMPKFLDVADIITQYDQYRFKALANSAFCDDLVKLSHQGIPLVLRADKAPENEGWITIDHPALRRAFMVPINKGGWKAEPEDIKRMLVKLPVKAHPDVAASIKAVLGDPLGLPGIGAIKAINAFYKKMWLSLSLFHHGALTESAVVGMSLPKTIGIWNPVNIWKAVKNNDYSYFTQHELVKDGLKHGLVIGPISDAQVGQFRAMLQGIEDATKRIPGLAQATHAVNVFNDYWDKILWDYLHTEFKIFGYEHLVNMEFDRAIRKAEPMDEKRTEHMKREIAAFVNDIFGGQNWRLLVKDPKWVEAMHLAFLAPDWNYSKIREALSMTGLGAIYRDSEDIRRRHGQRFWLRALIFFGIGVNALNYALSARDNNGQGHFMWQNDPGKKTLLYWGKYPDGTNKYLRWGKGFREIPEFFLDPAKKVGGKFGPLVQKMAVQFTGHSMSGFKNREIAGKGLWETLPARAKDLADVRPFSLTEVGDPGWDPSRLMFPQSKGMTPGGVKAMFIEELSKDKVDPQKIREIYNAAVDNNLSARQLLATAQRSIKTDITGDYYREAKKIVDRGKANVIEKLRDPNTPRSLKKKIRKVYGEVKRLKRPISEGGAVRLTRKAERELEKAER